MKTNLLLDENLSYKLVSKLSSFFDEVAHVKNLGFGNSLDLDIWHYAKLNNLAILTKDDDFVELAETYGAPPKIIWFRKGNCGNIQTQELIEKSAKEIKKFLADTTTSIFILE